MASRLKAKHTTGRPAEELMHTKMTILQPYQPIHFCILLTAHLCSAFERYAERTSQVHQVQMLKYTSTPCHEIP
ncbi:hypothetical protein VTL71DRAFT_12667 [Oculimacula yallundae]|uniref:Uncharacterized protein n=1 Tax=Oculimacula yallundae TaxID=86028 RepID=A0ABR4CPF8_9HELO